MGFMDGLGSLFKSSIGAFMGGAEGAMGDFGNRVTGDLLGAPNARSRGKDAEDYMNNAFPGTTPWERLGAGGAGTAGAGATTSVNKAMISNQRFMQSKDLANKLKIANIQAGASVKSSLAPYGIKAQAGLPYQTSVGIQERKVPHEIREMQARTRKADWESVAISKSEKWINRLSTAKYHLDSMGVEKARSGTDLLLKQILTETQRGLAEKSHAKLQAARAKFSKLLAKGELRLLERGNPWKLIVDTLERIYSLSTSVAKDLVPLNNKSK